MNFYDFQPEYFYLHQQFLEYELCNMQDQDESFERQQLFVSNLQRRVTALKRENECQNREITRLN